MTPAADGTRISIEDAEAREFRRSVIEWLMVNHPHDCPVCDEGGECHLQDMTVATGHNYRRYRFLKKTYRNQDLGPFIHHEMNRCIECYRCVRFYNDHAGGHDLQVFGAHDHVYFGRVKDGALESELAGNLVEVCPTGVFTDKSFKRHFTRKWDLQTAPSVCVHCSLGCNTTPGERYGALRRVRARYHGEVNGYFLCDRGRYGYEFVNHERRLRQPLRPRGPHATAQALSKAEAIGQLVALLGAGATDGRGRVVGIGSPRASLEANFALRALVGPERFFAGIPRQEHSLLDAVLDALRRPGIRAPSLQDVSRCDAVLVLGEDPTNTAPMLDYALRQAARRGPSRLAAGLGIPRWNDAAVRGVVQDVRGAFYLVTSAPTKLDGAARSATRAAPEDVARLGYAVARLLGADIPERSDSAPEADALAREIAGELERAERPLVVSGTGCGSEPVIRAAAAVASALARRRAAPAELCIVVPECNSLGLALLGGEPLDALDLRGDGSVTLIVLENDLHRRMAAADVDQLLGAAAHLVVLDHLAHETAARAELVLPVATFAEGDGTLVNNEGRAQRSFQVFPPAGEIQESWRWLHDAMAACGRGRGWSSQGDVVAAIASELPAFARLTEVAPPESSRFAGARIPRAQHRYSGRTAMTAHLDVREPRPPEDPDSPLAFSMEGYDGVPPARLVSEFWSPGWNSNQALHRFQEEVAGPLRGGDPGVRLLEPANAGQSERHGGTADANGKGVPDRFVGRAGCWRLVPLHHAFGSEELSILSPGVAELAPPAYLALGAEDASALGAAAGQVLVVELPGGSSELPLRVVEGLPRGVAGIPRGLAGVSPGPLPDFAVLRKVTP